MQMNLLNQANSADYSPLNPELMEIEDCLSTPPPLF